MPVWRYLPVVALAVVLLLLLMGVGFSRWGGANRGRFLSTEFRGYETNSMGQRCLIFGVRNNTRRHLELYASSPKGLSGDSATVVPGATVRLGIAIGTNLPPYQSRVTALVPAPTLVTRLIQYLERRKGSVVEGVSFQWAESPLPEDFTPPPQASR